MAKLKALVLCGIVLGLVLPSAWGAVPFKAPARFNLEGSQVNFLLRLESRRGQVEAALDPNPAPLTGAILVQQLNADTGAFKGAYEDISASTEAKVDKLGLTFTITLSLASDSLGGLFLWNRNQVVLAPESMTLTMTFGKQVWNVPLAGIPWVATYQDGRLSLDQALEFCETYLGYTFTLQMGIHLAGVLQPPAGDALWISLSTDKPAYTGTEHLKLYVSAGNGGPTTQRVDVYLALLAPSGVLYFAPPYGTSLQALVTDIDLVSGFYLPPLQLHDLPLPSTVPPIAGAGEYQFLAAFCKPGTLEILGSIAAAPFSYATAPPVSYDGTWDGTGTASGGDEECGSIATVHFDIRDSVITGWGETDLGEGYTVTGQVSASGTIVDGILWEEFAGENIAVGTFGGRFSGDTGNGTWGDRYGCSGSFSVTRTP